MSINKNCEPIESINWEREFPKVPACVHDAVNAATNEILAKEQSTSGQTDMGQSRIEQSMIEQSSIGHGMIGQSSIGYGSIGHGSIGQGRIAPAPIEGTKTKRIPAKRMLLLAAVITLLSGMTVMAATGLWIQRMEAMNREEIEEYFLSIAASDAPAFRYNRAMTEEERGRFEELTALYENEGVFPEGVLTMLASPEDYKGKGVGYEKMSGTFFLPEKELSREQLLQIIDFYHKAEYAVVNMNETTGSEELQEILTDEVVPNTALKGTDEGVMREGEGTQSADIVSITAEYEPLNAAVSYYEIPLQAKEVLSDIAAGGSYLYLGSKTEISRMPLGGSEVEAFYELKENEQLFAIDSDAADNVYLSLREYQVDTDSYVNRLIKLSAAGEAVLEYDLTSALYDEEKTLEDALAYKMIAGEDGLLYVKGGWSSKPVIFLFDAEGKCTGKVETDEYKTHTANGMCFDENGDMYVLANEELLKFDMEAKEATAAYRYWTDEMAAAVDLVYPMGANAFYVVSYDGLFRYTPGDEGSERLLAPYESGVFAEGYRCAPISGEELVIVNAVDYEKAEYKITYLSLGE